MTKNGFDIIPVIDLKGGAVVRAREGKRHLYAPIETPLSPTSRPADVVRGLLGLYPFRAVYIADLDAIEGKGDHSACVAALEAEFADIRFWLDAGIDRNEEIDAWLATHRGDLVLGTESLSDTRAVEHHGNDARLVLSLDYRGDAPQGPARLFEDESLWPQRLIVMTLGRVGSHTGPDIDRLSTILAQAEGRHRIYAAGGVRGAADLNALRRIGAAGVLIASALHDGHVTAADLALVP